MKTPLTIPAEYKTKCPNCGVTLDIRNLEQTLSHGLFDEELGEFICLPDTKTKSQTELTSNKSDLYV